MDDNIEKMVKEIFGKDIKKNETSSASSASASSLSSTAASATSTAASSATSLGSIDTKVDSTSQVTLSPEKSVVEKRSFSDQDYVKQYTAFLKHILERAKNREVTWDNGSQINADILGAVEELLNTKTSEGFVEPQASSAHSISTGNPVLNETIGAKEGILSAVEELLNSKEFTTSSVPITTGQNGENGPEVDKTKGENGPEIGENGPEVDKTKGENGPEVYKTKGVNVINGENGADGVNTVVEKTAATAKASSCGNANVCIEDINNEGINTDTTIYEAVGTGKDRVIVVRGLKASNN